MPAICTGLVIHGFIESINIVLRIYRFSDILNIFFVNEFIDGVKRASEN